MNRDNPLNIFIKTIPFTNLCDCIAEVFLFEVRQKAGITFEKNAATGTGDGAGMDRRIDFRSGIG